MRSLSVTAYTPDQSAFTVKRFPRAGPDVAPPGDAERVVHPIAVSLKSGVLLFAVLYPTEPEVSKFLK